MDRGFASCQGSRRVRLVGDPAADHRVAASRRSATRRRSDPGRKSMPRRFLWRRNVAISQSNIAAAVSTETAIGSYRLRPFPSFASSLFLQRPHTVDHLDKIRIGDCSEILFPPQPPAFGGALDRLRTRAFRVSTSSARYRPSRRKKRDHRLGPARGDLDFDLLSHPILSAMRPVAISNWVWSCFQCFKASGLASISDRDLTPHHWRT